ncbi:hypothetical protein EJ03DRAFT_27882 [Teratosphaeria nubilosa]|uniref:DUF1330 domain-containing protein n=1 Tax=Teratosphaeria nubilosa TaxID=161662 RepID=A0A6G1KV08_9PEZI|nr:hypothetical protein EJ03DRAFT_27882 [Teratosphaeria nubilosa]
MPLATLHLLALAPNATINQYLRALSSFGIKPLVASKAVRWIINPAKLSVSKLLDTNWSLLLILPASTKLPDAYLGKDWVLQHWSITAGIPSSLLQDFDAKNHRLLHPHPGDVPPLTGAIDTPRITSSAQGLELNPELREWSRSFPLGQENAVSMLNLLAFNPGNAAHASYQRYGKAFAESIGRRRGGTAKIVGRVVRNQGSQGEDASGWDEIALAHYPSIRHFVDMIASEDYQVVNHRERLPALRDTCILCTTELDPEVRGGKGPRL